MSALRYILSPLFIGLRIYILFKDIGTSDCVMSNCWIEGGEVKKKTEWGPGPIKDPIRQTSYLRGIKKLRKA